MSRPAAQSDTVRAPRPLLLWTCALTTGAVLLIGLTGPFFAPHSPTTQITTPYAAPSPGLWLGGDHLGRDVLSRLLDGGPSVVLTSVLATAIAVATGTAAGLVSALLGHQRGRSGLVMRPLDAVAALPPVLALLLVLTAVPGRLGVVIAAAVASAPLSARVVHAAVTPVLRRPHVELAIARGEGWGWLLRYEVLPLISATVHADVGLRFVLALYLVTAAGFLGIGSGGSDWGTLVVEALPGATLQPVALIAPLLLIATLAVSVNLLSDSVTRRTPRTGR
ncbi:ABC transporter permease [Streptomyces sp. NBC_00690]|uniref:ABC transporter permease n=1 Tax=Streptomyces sp. NBC_00690 TaxID=2975808 RepID=UPI002E2A677E|nr:ABC transporter permease subunit [Streptomyces sp. NBC_00690]